MSNHPDLQPNRYTSFPFMTMFIIIINMLVFIGQTLLEDYSVELLNEIIYLFGSVPTLIISQQGAGALSTVTSTFLHGNLFHLIGNMVPLWAFSRRVEDVCGPWRFLTFYLTCGVVADMISTLSRSTENIPGIGASGAVYGVMAAYLILFPRRKITLVDLTRYGYFPISFMPFWVILFFLLKEIPIALEVLIGNVDSNVAHWAHLGGFFAGTLILLYLRPDAFHRFRNELPL